MMFKVLFFCKNLDQARAASKIVSQRFHVPTKRLIAQKDVDMGTPCVLYSDANMFSKRREDGVSPYESGEPYENLKSRVAPFMEGYIAGLKSRR